MYGEGTSPPPDDGLVQNNGHLKDEFNIDQVNLKHLHFIFSSTSALIIILMDSSDEVE